jgi:hypothetical protein
MLGTKNCSMNTENGMNGIIAPVTASAEAAPTPSLILVLEFTPIEPGLSRLKVVPWMISKIPFAATSPAPISMNCSSRPRLVKLSKAWYNLV